MNFKLGTGMEYDMSRIIDMRTKAQTPLIRFVVDLLYKSTTNRISGVWA